MAGKVARIERLARLETKARSLARSGAHLDFSTIAAGLVQSDYPEAKAFFANRWTQQELNRICEQTIARRRHPAVGGPVSGYAPTTEMNIPAPHGSK